LDLQRSQREHGKAFAGKLPRKNRYITAKLSAQNRKFLTLTGNQPQELPRLLDSIVPFGFSSVESPYQPKLSPLRPKIGTIANIFSFGYPKPARRKKER
jgi:hypothetical protein